MQFFYKAGSSKKIFTKEGYRQLKNASCFKLKDASSLNGAHAEF